jgi:hypothetical protein
MLNSVTYLNWTYMFEWQDVVNYDFKNEYQKDIFFKKGRTTCMLKT